MESPAFDAVCLFEKVFGFGRHGLIINGNNAVKDDDKIKELLLLADKRKNGEPLQYIMGTWHFMGLDFNVGRGVLIPREDTGVVVGLCIKKIKKQRKQNNTVKILDLCAGSGAISVVLAKNIENCNVTALELSSAAFEYLKKNIEQNKADNVQAVKGDVFKDYDKFEKEYFDVIISNPPYIESGVIKKLQKEVQNEPILALDGGKDGLDFYKAITEGWTPLIKPGGILTFELGEGQSKAVKAMMENAGFTDIETENDIGQVKRGIAGIKA